MFVEVIDHRFYARRRNVEGGPRVTEARVHFLLVALAPNGQGGVVPFVVNEKNELEAWPDAKVFYRPDPPLPGPPAGSLEWLEAQEQKEREREKG